MQNTSKKFDVDAAIRRRMKEMRGELIVPDDIDEIGRYTKSRMQQIREKRDRQIDIDRSCLACYTIGTMGDRDGET